jgi:hypothetical protein
MKIADAKSAIVSSNEILLNFDLVISISLSMPDRPDHELDDDEREKDSNDEFHIRAQRAEQRGRLAQHLRCHVRWQLDRIGGRLREYEKWNR